jgi:signal transduction histidine kinase
MLRSGSGMAEPRTREGALIEAGLALASELSLPAILQRIVELAVQVTDARYGALGVVGDSAEIAEFVTTGVTPEERAAIGHLPVGRGVLGVLIHEARPLRLHAVSDDPHSVGFPPNHPAMGPFLGMPVKARGQVFGNIYLTRVPGADDFAPQDEQALAVLASQAGVAIENARLHEELQRMVLSEDRERIAKDLHDGVIQSLFAVGMGLQATAALSGAPEVERRIESAVEELDRAIRDLRNYIFGLRPGILADRQLDQALRGLVDDFEEKTGVLTVVEIDANAAAELSSNAGEIVQIVREALSNAGRHAKAATCRITLRPVEGGAVVEVDDDGVGFDATTESPGLGLRNLRDRAAAMGGELSITSVPGEGTSVRLFIARSVGR